MRKHTYDFLVFGAGIFGIYAATIFSARGLRVLIVDTESQPWKKASAVNQARVHFGYHYPRSVATAKLANEHRARFQRDHEKFINKRYTCYYGIDRHGSLTSSRQFQRFCDYIGIPFRETTRPELFATERIESLFETTEYSFDPMLLRAFYLDRLASGDVEKGYGWKAVSATASGSEWEVEFSTPEGFVKVVAGRVLNAAYANINTINRLFNCDEIELVHELSEVAFIASNELNNIGLTVMDGPFVSVMPYGKSSLSSLTSVPYTHHDVSREADPVFRCQQARIDCNPDSIRICTSCSAKPRSNANKMIAQLRSYLSPGVSVEYRGSLFTIKTKLKSSFVDDARPTDVRTLRRGPDFSYVFSGKINSIYEVEGLIDDY